MKKAIIASVLVSLVATPALAQAPSTAPAAKPAEAATDPKFVAADKDKSGLLEGAEVDAYKADIAKIDTNKDGKISKDEFAAAMKSGIIK